MFFSSYIMPTAIVNFVCGIATFALGVVFKPYASPLPNRLRATLDAANAWMYLCGVCAAVRTLLSDSVAMRGCLRRGQSALQALPLTAESRDAILIGLSSVVLLILAVGMGTNVVKISKWLLNGCQVRRRRGWRIDASTGLICAQERPDYGLDGAAAIGARLKKDANGHIQDGAPADSDSATNSWRRIRASYSSEGRASTRDDVSTRGQRAALT